MDYKRIIDGIVSSSVNGNIWVKPWSDTGTDDTIIKRIDKIDNILREYYKAEKIAYFEKCQDRSFYSPTEDIILLPAIWQFINTPLYYAVKFHETIHSTGEYTRCYRDCFNEFKSLSFGDSRYSKEELIAEIGSCLLMHCFGINTELSDNNTKAYINNWLAKCNNNTKWIYYAADLATEAIEYISEVVGIDLLGGGMS